MRRRIVAVYADRSVRTKVLAGAIAAIITALTVGVTAIVQFDRLGTQARNIETQALIPMARLGAVRHAVLQTRVDAVADALLGDRAGNTEHEAYLNDLTMVDKALAAYQAVDNSPGGSQGQSWVSRFETAWGEYKALVGRGLLALARAHDWAGYTALRDSKVKPAAEEYNQALTALEAKEARDAKSHVDAAHASAVRGRILIISLLVLGTVAATGLALAVANEILTAARRVSKVIKGLALGDLTRSADVSARDELGRMASGLNTATATLRDMLSQVAANALALSEASQAQSRIAGQISRSADRSSDQSVTASAAAEEVSRNVQTVAAGAEEMSASIREIARNSTDAATIAQRAVAAAAGADTTITQLGASSTEIDTVVKMITSIAAQTKLLSLNATIEAARAGEAGKGFAIVAGEVKELAQRTETATQEITSQIATIQDHSQAAIMSINEIGSVIEEINAHQTTIASAIEEQAATTMEMTRNVTSAATGTDQIAATITVVATTADETRIGVTESRQAADTVARMSDDLRILAARFTF
jgi:methyl-accepting chemotaxis protein